MKLARLSIAASMAVVSITSALHAQTPAPIEIGFLWHMHQPIYFPGENITQSQNAGRYSFSIYDVHNQRKGPYTDWPRNAIINGQDRPNLGASVSFSGSLIENLNQMQSVGVNGGMWNNWQGPYTQARNTRTARNNSRLDLVGFTYHHALGPLMDERDLRMQIRMHKTKLQQTFGNATPYSKGFFPAETAFSSRMIPALVAEGFEWAIVDNIHFDRATQNYPHTNSSNLYAPNRADQINPDPAANGGAWIQLNNLWAPSKVSAPFSYRPHQSQYVNPNTGQIQKIVAVPGARYEGNEDGRGGFGALQYESVMNQYRHMNTDPNRPMLVVLHHDGDNFGGGSEGYYNGNWNNMLNWVRNTPNYNVTTIQDYLDRFPVPQNAVIHIEPGSWAGADNGDPEFKKWLGDPNPTTGWSPDRNSWAVLTAAKNRVYTAEDILGGASPQNAINNTGNAAERGWHYLTQAQASDHWYWDGTEIWDSNVTRGANLAAMQANAVLTPHNLQNETTPPSVFLPQRDIYNPGEVEWGPNPESPDFNIWTYAYDVSGLTSVTLKYRIDGDGTNPLSSIQNETYAGGSEVGQWVSIPMTSSDVAPPSGILAANYRALMYSAPINGIRSSLLDYFVEAVDARGNITRSEIQHVWVGDGDNTPPPPPPPPPGSGWVMDGVRDSGAALIAENGMQLHGGVADGKLYLSTQDAGEGSDHYIFVARPPGNMTAAPWAKSGQVAQWLTFLADENDNDFEGWFSATGALVSGADRAAATGPNGGVLEGTLDLVSIFGEYPEEIWLAVGIYGNANGGTLLNTHQIGATSNNDGNIDAVEYIRYVLPMPEWKGDASGNWSDKTRWLLTTVPSGQTMTAKLLSRGSGAAIVNLDQNVTLNKLELAGTGHIVRSDATPRTITFAGTATRAISVTQGQHEIDAAINITKNAEIDVAATSSLKIVRRTDATNLTKLGAGQLAFAELRATSLSINAGQVALLASGGGVSRVGSLTIASGASLDLGTDALIVDSVSQLASIRSMIASGVIDTSTTDARLGVGYALASSLLPSLPGSWMGQSIDGDAVLVRVTLLGDANLDGAVGFEDLTALARGYDQPGAWHNGDSNHDGLVNFTDLLALARNYNVALTSTEVGLFGSDFASDWNLARAAIPEPATLGLLAVAVPVLGRRRRD